MSAVTLLARLDGVRRLPPRRGFASSHVARCPAHDDRRPSLGVDETPDGRVLLICRSAGCSAHEIVAAAGLELHDLYPPRPVTYADTKRGPRYTPRSEVPTAEAALKSLEAAARHAAVLALVFGDAVPPGLRLLLVDLSASASAALRAAEIVESP